MLGVQIQKVLKKKLDEYNLTKKEFAAQSGITYRTLLDLENSSNFNPSIFTIVKMANYFNCSMDEILGRQTISSVNVDFKLVTPEQINNNLRKFIKDTLQKENLNHRQVSIEIGFNPLAIFKFIQEGSTLKSTSSGLAVAFADRFNISLDQMIGRIEGVPAFIKLQMPDERISEVKDDKTLEKDIQIHKTKSIEELTGEIKNLKSMLQRFIKQEQLSKK